MKQLISRVGAFQLVDRRDDEDESSSRSKVSPYDWKPEYWHAYPVEGDYQTAPKPWERPEQVTISFVGEFRLPPYRNGISKISHVCVNSSFIYSNPFSGHSDR